MVKVDDDSDDITTSDSDHELQELSEYEMRREKRIAENKQKFEEIFGSSRRSTATKFPKTKKARKVKHVTFILASICI